MELKLAIIGLVALATAGLLFYLYSKTQLAADPKKRWRPTLETKIFGAILLALGAFILMANLSPDTRPTPSFTATTAQTAPAPPKKEDIEINQVLAGAQALKESMKKPETFELLHASMIDGSVICYEYRARNSFNDRRTEYFVLSKTVVSGAAKDWNKHCAGKSGTDYTSVRAVLR